MHRDRTNVLWLPATEATALNHCRPRHADAARFGRNTNIRRAEQRRIASKAITMIYRNPRNPPCQCRPAMKGGHIQPRHRHQHIGITRTAAAALGVHHNGQVILLSDLQQPVNFAVMKIPLGARQHAVVVDDQRRLALLTREQISIDGADRRNHRICGGLCVQRVTLTPRTLGRDRQLTVL